MDWKMYSRFMWMSGMKGDGMNFKFCKSDIVDNDGVFVVIPHYYKSFAIKGYSVWYQSKAHVQQGGSNFALKINRKCSSFDDGVKIAEQFYTDFKSGKNPKFVGTQYFDSDTYMEGTFCE